MKSDALDATLAARTKEKWRISRSVATATRRRRDRLKGQPQERQHSAAVRRDAGPTAEISPETRRECEKPAFRRNKCEKADGS